MAGETCLPQLSINPYLSTKSIIVCQWQFHVYLGVYNRLLGKSGTDMEQLTYHHKWISHNCLICFHLINTRLTSKFNCTTKRKKIKFLNKQFPPITHFDASLLYVRIWYFLWTNIFKIQIVYQICINGTLEWSLFKDHKLLTLLYKWIPKSIYQ